MHLAETRVQAKALCADAPKKMPSLLRDVTGRLLVTDLQLDPATRADLTEHWNLVRMRVAVLATLVAGVYAMFVPRAGVAAALVALIATDAFLKRRRPRPALAILLDSTLGFTALDLLGAPEVVFPFAWLYFGIAVIFLVPVRLQLIVALYASAWLGTTIYIDLASWEEPLGFRTLNLLGWAAGIAYTMLALDLIGSVVLLLRRSIATADGARAELQDLVRSKDEFVASISHELRTPLTGIVGFASELHGRWDDFADEERRAMVGLVAGQAGDMGTIIEDLLVAARADAGSLTLRSEVVALRPLLEDVSRHGRPDDRSLPVDCPDLSVAADPVRLRQVIRNLSTNAVRYGGPHIWIEARRRRTQVSIRVCDNGPGIDTADRARMFEPYERGRAAEGQPASIGLGLSVARRLTEMMDGAITYHRTGGTSVFEVTLPVVSAERASA